MVDMKKYFGFYLLFLTFITSLMASIFSILSLNAMFGYIGLMVGFVFVFPILLALMVSILGKIDRKFKLF
jgi:hypothetical protein